MPYRTASLVLPHRPWRLNLRGLRWLAVGVFLPVLLSGAVQRASPGDDEGPGAPVEHALLLGGDGHTVCALTRVANERFQVVCAAARTESRRGDMWQTASTWESPRLRQVLPVLVDGETDRVAALGLREDGELVVFHPHRRFASALALPSTGPHGPITHLYGIEQQRDPLGEPDAEGHALHVRTRDGALLLIAIPSDLSPIAASPGWVSTRVARSSSAHGAIAEVGVVAPGRVPESDWIPGIASYPEGIRGTRPMGDFLFLPSNLADAVLAAGIMAVLDREGHVRVYRSWMDHAPSRAEGLPARVTALAGRSNNLCVRGADATWHCLNDITAVDAPPPGDVTFHSSPSLQGATEVVMGEEVSCARWPEGSVRCWGWHLESAGIPLPTPREIPGLDQVSSLTADQHGHCALRRGEVYCWRPDSRESREAQPTRVPLPPGVTLLVPRHLAAVGSSVWHFSASADGATKLPDDPIDGTSVVSLFLRGDVACARRASGGVSCWSRTRSRRSFLWSRPSRPAWSEHARWNEEDFSSYGPTCHWSGSLDVGPAVGHCVAGDDIEIPGASYRCGNGFEFMRRQQSWERRPTNALVEAVARSVGNCVMLSDRRVACGRRSGCSSDRIHWQVLSGITQPCSLPQHGLRDDVHCALRNDGHVLCWGHVNRDLRVGTDEACASGLVPLTRAP